jgi:cyclopropane-fatty-acyl-phospholipid synthase
MAKQGFYERLLLNELSKMQLGKMTITLPDGENLIIGGKDNGVKADIRINDSRFFRRCVLYGDIGFGEAYTDGDWDTSDISNVIRWFILNIENAPTVSGSSARSVALNLLKFVNLFYHARRDNTVSGSRRNISEHYDLNNDFFSLWLDPTMTYSSAYFREESFSLEEAQKAKYARLAAQLHLKPDHHVLEIGSGWGGNAIFLAQNFGCRVTSVTISEEQQKLAMERVRKLGLEDRVSVIIKDYRKIEGQFDRIVSIEMLEAVGAAHFESFFAQCHKLLKKDGILAFQVITCPDPRFEALRDGVDWIQKHIFPGSLLPSVAAINAAVNKTGDMSLVDMKDLGLHYARTLKTWNDNFNGRREEVKQLGFSESFCRKWNYYLCYCEAAFDMRNINVMQMVYTRPNNRNR